MVSTIVVESLDLKCEVKHGNWKLTDIIEYCQPKNVNVRSRNEKLTSVNGRTEPTNFTGLFFDQQTVHYLPKGIDKFFPNLKGLAAVSSKLKLLTQDDLKPLTQLVSVIFSSNDLETCLHWLWCK